MHASDYTTDDYDVPQEGTANVVSVRIRGRSTPPPSPPIQRQQQCHTTTQPTMSRGRSPPLSASSYGAAALARRGSQEPQRRGPCCRTSCLHWKNNSSGDEKQKQPVIGLPRKLLNQRSTPQKQTLEGRVGKRITTQTRTQRDGRPRVRFTLK